MRKRVLGTLLIVFPWVFLPTILGVYAVTSFLLATGEGSTLIGPLTRVLLGVGGVVGVLGFVVGIPVGIYFLTRKEPDLVATLKQRPRFQGLSDDDVHAVARWSWGAFCQPAVWALGNRLWLWALGTLIPVWGVYAWLRLCLDGRQIAWERSSLTFSQFQKRQAVIGWVIVGLIVLSLVLSVVTSAMQSSGGNRAGLALDNASSVALSAGDTDGKESVGSDDAIPLEAVEEPTVQEQQDRYCEGGRDADGDGLLNDYEENDFGTDPHLVDTDGDGYGDFDELKNGYNPNDAVVIEDTDGDGLADGWEKNFYMTNAKKSDSDGDGVDDLAEVRAGTNPDGDGTMEDLLDLVSMLVARAMAQCR